MNIENIKKEVIPACSEFEVHKLFAFSSFSRGIESLASDISFFVEFDSSERSPSKRYFGLLHRLEDVLESRIDLVTEGSCKNPYAVSRMMKERVLVYEK